MNSETIILQDGATKADTFASWLSTLTEYFTGKGFTIAEGEGFGVIDNEMIFGIQVTDNMGIAIYSEEWNDIYSKFALGVYTIVDGAVTLSQIAITNNSIHLTSSASHTLNVNYHKDNNNTYIDIQFPGLGFPFASYLITPLIDLEVNDTSDIFLMVMNSKGYVMSVITPSRLYTTTTTIRVEPLTMGLVTDRYTCYSCPIMIHDESLRGVLPHVKGIKGNFTHAFAQEIILEGKQYYHLGNNIYLPL